jgi:hypothetical protein
MFNRGILFIIVLGAAIVVPYVMFDDGLSKTARSEWQRFMGPGDGSVPAQGGSLSWFQSQPQQPLPLDNGPSLPPVSIEEALRLDVTPVWVTSRWTRVGTVVGDTDQMGLRVALVSGVQPNDVAGSLTYYFDQRHQLQKITFTGMTGDESRIITHLMNNFGLRPAPTLTAGLYQAQVGPNKMSTAHVNHLPVVRASATNARRELAIELFRPGVVEAPISAAKETVPPRGPNTPGPRIW